ncbi:M56 family metallopeptidase [Coleofasciculus sp. FACHB-T130]|uniref:M56 family metallopeptidase n=1 Tax=Cyanophyceae TaxID=3028117 RepID=UPI0016848D6F|nr:M56 family metallopeptidase [Coleofasciculus sp. FACHB-T130]MBD1882351.1 M56 family metallopeptidase [Coleofasciculus sp. FACHB-T130]
MHLAMILTALGLAWCLRCTGLEPSGTWTQRWQRSFGLFLFPPLLLIVTAIAVICMGADGKMGGLQAGWFSYSFAWGFLGVAGILCLKLAHEGWRSVQQTRTYPQIELEGKLGRLLNASVLFSAQIGFWQPELVVSQGLLETLDRDHLEAVLAHEQAHYYYRDTFWFFWLGWVRQITAWLPNTEALWQELLLLRELRADRWAAQQVDPLLLAESLLLVVSVSPVQSESFCAAFSAMTPRNRLEERIEALLAPSEESASPSIWLWHWILLGFLPLVTVPFHT